MNAPVLDRLGEPMAPRIRHLKSVQSPGALCELNLNLQRLLLGISLVGCLNDGAMPYPLRGPRLSYTRTSCDVAAPSLMADVAQRHKPWKLSRRTESLPTLFPRGVRLFVVGLFRSLPQMEMVPCMDAVNEMSMFQVR